MADRQILVNVLRPRPWVCMTLLLIHAASGFSQETDFSPFARFGLGTAQGNLTPAIASIGGITSVSTSNSVVNADQPAAAASMLNPTFQGSVHVQRMELEEGSRTANAITGGPGNFGLVIKQPRSLKAIQLGLTPLTSKAFGIHRSIADSTLGDIEESYLGSGGLARTYLGLAHGWRGRNWREAGFADSVLITSSGLDLGFQVDHWFGDAIQTSSLDIEDMTFRDVRTVVSSRHRATGWVLGAEAFHILKARYDEFKQFRGSWTLRVGCTWSPKRDLSTDFSRLVESTLIVNGLVTGIDTSAFEQATLTGGIPQAWTLGSSIQWDGGRGNRLGFYFDLKQQSWGESNQDLAHLMEGAARWGDASSMSVGLLWTPGRKPGKLSRPTYRAGYTQATLPVILDFESQEARPLEEWRVSMGINTPLKGSRSGSQLHLGMDVGQRYTDLASIHREFSLRLHVGVTLTPFAKNLWLTPRLYD